MPFRPCRELARRLAFLLVAGRCVDKFHVATFHVDKLRVDDVSRTCLDSSAARLGAGSPGAPLSNIALRRLRTVVCHTLLELVGCRALLATEACAPLNRSCAALLAGTGLSSAGHRALLPRTPGAEDAVLRAVDSACLHLGCSEALRASLLWQQSGTTRLSTLFRAVRRALAPASPCTDRLAGARFRVACLVIVYWRAFRPAELRLE